MPYLLLVLYPQFNDDLEALVVRPARPAGVARAEPVDHGFMVQHSFGHLDGHGAGAWSTWRRPDEQGRGGHAPRHLSMVAKIVAAVARLVRDLDPAEKPAKDALGAALRTGRPWRARQAGA